MNMQLNLANAAAAAAKERWSAHKHGCPKCSAAQRSRHPQDMCGHGGRLYADMKACDADLAQERKLAKQPIPGQIELFGEAEAGGRVPRQSRRRVSS